MGNHNPGSGKIPASVILDRLQVERQVNPNVVYGRVDPLMPRRRFNVDLPPRIVLGADGQPYTCTECLGWTWYTVTASTSIICSYCLHVDHV